MSTTEPSRTIWSYEWVAMGLRLVNETNAREHWSARARRAKRQRHDAFAHTRKDPFTRERASRYRITITRLGPRKLDSDNLAASGKHVRDGIADAIGIDDRSDLYDWVYAQEASKVYGVRVRIEGLA